MTAQTRTAPRMGSAYLDFRQYGDGMAARDRDAFAAARLLFVYPVLGANEFELVEHPVSQRILISVMRSLGAEIHMQVVPLDAEAATVAPEGTPAPDWIVIHPMVGTLDRLKPLLARYRARFPDARVVLQNSDQHQHEKAIGGPRAAEIAAEVLGRLPEIDWILVGFAEHTLAELVAGRATEAAIGRKGSGRAPAALFSFDSLPGPELAASTGRDRTIRVQRGRGCLSPCTFCTEGQINRVLPYEKPWDGLGVDAFVSRIESIAKEGYFFFTITDSSFEDPGRRGIDEMRAFCRAVLDRGLRLSFKIHMRAESVLKLEADDFGLMKAAGIDVIGMGIESANAEELALFRKIASKNESQRAYERIEATGDFCVILGYIMFSATSTPAIVNEKIEFLREIRRGWDFLILTNRLQVFWGTVMHKELVALGLAEDGRPLAGYVPYRFRDDRVAAMDGAITAVKRRRPEFMELNNLMYDAINLEVRMLNPANAHLRAAVGARFDEFRDRMRRREKRLSDLYCDAMRAVSADPSAPFLPDHDGKAELESLRADINALIAPLQASGLSTDTLYLRTWMAVRDKLSVA